MIPLKLTLRNFMGYRDNVPPLDFSGIHTACISGDNGAGKSALIDAMTWALWGETRAKALDDLIYTGQTEMTVEFDFTVSGQTYRVVRKRARPRTAGGVGQSLLEFYLVTENGLTTLTGDTIADTEKKIVSLLHMKYDTFINSAFLRQGHADEFTVRSAAERKQVLADILGFQVYDRLEKKAREQARAAADTVLGLDNQIMTLEEPLSRKAEWSAALTKAQEELEEITRLVNEQEKQRDHLRGDWERLEHRKQQLNELNEHIAQRRREMERWGEQAGEHRKRVAGYQTLLEQRVEIESQLEQLQQARCEDTARNQILRRLNTLGQEEKQLLAQINQARQELVSRQVRQKTERDTLETRAKRRDALIAEEAELRQELAAQAAVETRLADKRQAVRDQEARLAELSATLSVLQTALGENDQRLNLLHTGSETCCPLCERELSPESSLRLKGKLEAEKQRLSDSLAKCRDEIARLKTSVETLRPEALALEAALKKEQGALHRRQGQLSASRADADAAFARLPEAHRQLEETEAQLENQSFALAEQARLRVLAEERQSFAYDAAEHESIREQVNRLSPAEAAYQKLAQAEQSLSRETAELARAEKYVAEIAAAVAADIAKSRGLAEELQALPGITAALEKGERLYQEQVARHKECQEKTGGLKERLARLAEMETRRTELRQAREQAAIEQGTYKELALAFGHNGIPAMLIDMALPEIESEADKLLSRMTDNRMHLRLETQRPTKKGELAETLDIKISDELGTRDYELFSGGEAFRINFAIRIALSRLLARRAGAPLPTLIIDEGFGTQDATGIEKLREAINSIQDDFERILVITHIDELKDAFPTRIDVVKTDDGSTIEVR